MLLLYLKNLLLERVPIGNHLIEGHFEVEAGLHHVTVASISLYNVLVALRHHHEGVPNL